MAKKTSKKKSGSGAAKHTTAPKLKLGLARPALTSGEEYVGAIIGADGKGHHVILLAGDESGTWDAMMESAKKRGGDLPDRVEQALLYRDHKDKFQKDWYWSNQRYAGVEDYAWYQYFGDGYQYRYPRSSTFRARAVRRAGIQ